MIRHLLILSTTLLPAFLAISCHPGNQEKNEENTAFGVKLITLDPGHFHAALVLDYEKDINVLNAKKWPKPISLGGIVTTISGYRNGEKQQRLENNHCG